MRKLLIAALFAAAPLFGQQMCILHQELSMGAATGQIAPAAGNTVVVPLPPDLNRNINICAVYLSVTQGGTPANFQLRGCSDATCSNQQNLTPLYTGHANYLDTYNSAPFMVLDQALRGNGVFLYLSSVPTAANVQIFYSMP